MILPGKIAMTRGIVSGVREAAVQAQPCGIDLSLRKVLQWTSAGTVDFSNQHRKGSETISLEFAGIPKLLHLRTGSYMLEFNEEVDIPLNVMGQIFVRSSLWRTGALLSAGVMDSGYQGTIGALLQVVNSNGITLHENARLAQMVFHELCEEAEGYHGVYQGAKGLQSGAPTESNA